MCKFFSKFAAIFRTMKRFLYFVGLIGVAICGAMGTIQAENRAGYIENHNELRIGWGDQLFESLMWHNPTYITTTMPVTNNYLYRENYKHYQHLWLEYQWRFNHWFGLGGMIDGSGVSWDEVTRNGAGTEVSRDPNHHFFNLVIMPTVRFTYYHHENVNLYSGLGLGLGINGGSEVNAKGKKTDVGAAVNVTVFGVSANYNRWFMTTEFGGLTSLKNMNTVYMLCSRIINVSIGARF